MIKIPLLTRSLLEPGGPCTKYMEVSESCMERVKSQSGNLFHTLVFSQVF